MSKRPTQARLEYAITSLKHNVKEEDLPHVWALIYEIEGLTSENAKIVLALKHSSNTITDLAKNRSKFANEQYVLSEKLYRSVTEVLGE
jgi:hypothetical protein